jgi:hypothetical protein
MTYHHLNRLISHSNAKLTPRERLLAWHLAYQIRSKTSTFSRAGRSLETDLVMDRRTIQKNLAYLIEIGLFTRQKGEARKADIYQLNISCPLGCEDLETHNTPREVKLLAAEIEEALKRNTPEEVAKMSPQTSKVVANRKEEREEEELGAFELGVIGEVLANLKTLNEDQLTLKGFLELKPLEVAQAALEITKHLDTPKRIRAYLATTVTKTPNSLLTYAEHHKATLEGATRLKKARAEQTPAANTKGLTPEISWERVKGYCYSIIEGYEPSFLTKLFLEKKARRGQLTIREVFLAKSLEELIHNKAFPLMKPEVADPNNGAIYFDLARNGKIEACGHLDYWLVGDLSFLYTPQELKEEAQRNNALLKWKQIWLEQHPNEDFNPNAFFMDSTTRVMLAGLPKPISESEKVERFLAAITKTARAFEATATLGGDLPAETFIDHLKANFTLESDFNEWLLVFPERETGSHNKNRKKAYPAYLEARRTYSAQDLRSLAGTYSNKLDKKEFAKNPETFLGDLVADQTKAAY